MGARNRVTFLLRVLASDQLIRADQQLTSAASEPLRIVVDHDTASASSRLGLIQPSRTGKRGIPRREAREYQATISPPGTRACKRQGESIWNLHFVELSSNRRQARRPRPAHACGRPHRSPQPYSAERRPRGHALRATKRPAAPTPSGPPW